MLTPLANLLGVSLASLEAMRVGWATAAELDLLNTRCVGRGCWTFPMRDDRGNVIGVRLRGEPDSAGRCRKYAVRGGPQGLFVPNDLPGMPAVICVAEGASDTAALLTLGLPAIGLPSAGQGGDLLTLLIGRMNPDRVLLVADADEPGRTGMAAVAGMLASCGVGSRTSDPPGSAKDIRAYLNAGGDAVGILKLLDGEAEGTVRP